MRRRAARWKLHLQRRYQQMHGRSFIFFFPAVTSCVCSSFQTSATREEMRPSHASTAFLPRDARAQDYGSSPADKMSHQEMVSRCVRHSIARRGCSRLRGTTPVNLLLLSGGACWLDGQEEQQQEEEEEHQIVEEHASLRQEGEPSFMHEEMTQLHLSGTQEETDEYQIEVTEFLSLSLLCFASSGWNRLQEGPSRHLLADTGVTARVFQ